ncbi:uncharacterized protein LOC118348906 [Juglans regia]|uniref:Uncharacterized protein LOC118348906 n=1 Tax=Juglans regia TaxID=51240 RepID=A0A6P9EU46_JUGRE|nr:uncharacterized protein LOC118348906 [Juglans regia]
MEGCLVVEPIGKKGGLALFWGRGIDLEIIHYSQWHISSIIRGEGGKNKWIFTGFYGHPDASKRNLSWELLASLSPKTDEAWCIGGDFNELLRQEEKKGGKLRDERGMSMFREVLSENNLSDLGYVGCPFTWSNKHGDQTFTKERLDRFVANHKWRDMFRRVKVKSLVAVCSDHRPIVLEVRETPFMVGRRERSFFFEASWIKDEECEEVLKEWARDKEKNRGKELGKLAEEIKLLQDNEGPENVERIKGLQKQMGRKRNQINQVEDSNGRLWEEHEDIERAFYNHYQQVYQSNSPSRETIDSCLSAMESSITTEMNEGLQRAFTKEEVEATMQQIGSLKSPGPDGFGAAFYQNYWKVVGEEVIEAVLSFLKGDGNQLSMNHTHVVLIPKTKEPLNSAFIPGRLITDNIIVAYEILHSMKLKKKGKKGSMALKLDISKAYDRVEWGFLRAVMVKMGFGEKWVALIMNCVQSVSYAIVVNGKPGNTFVPTRGLRQGDPLSPYLFLLCVEGLSTLINHAESKGELKGVSVARGGTRVTHLLFADDCVVFGQASWQEWMKMKELLDIYEKASGQCLNRQKTSLFFSTNTKNDIRRMIRRDVGVGIQNCCEKYLGLPVMVGKSQYNTFRGIKDRVWSKISNWKNHFLSPSGKEVLLKAVVQSVPTYHMNVFKLPVKLCKEIAGLMASFWWGSQNNERRIQWKSWANMGKAKSEGGMGFRELQSFNTALLAKQCWRVLNMPFSVAARVLKDKYFKNTDLLKAKLGYGPSKIWRSLWGSLGLLKEGLVWRVGNGEQVNIWEDKWVPRPTLFSIQSPRINVSPEAKVKQLLLNGRWNSRLVYDTFLQEEADIICGIPVSLANAPDKRIWAFTKDGLYSVKSGYHLERSRRGREKGCSSEDKVGKEVWNRIWKLNTPEVVKMFIWRAVVNSLPTKMNLKCRKVIENPLCPVCGRENESICHVLWSCSASADVWADKESPVQKWQGREEDFMDLWMKLTEKLHRQDLDLVATVMRNMWWRRNAFIFENTFKGPYELFLQAQETLKGFVEANAEGEGIIRRGEVQKIEVKWKRPENGFVKVNWDGSLDAEKKRKGVGIVVRDGNGEVLISLCGSDVGFCSPAVAELQALWRALKLCAELQWNKVIFEGDAMGIIDAVNRQNCCWEWHGQVVEDIKLILQNRPNWSIRYTNRKCNRVAHMLAKMGLDVTDETVWMEGGPTGIYPFVLQDISCNVSVMR